MSLRLYWTVFPFLLATFLATPHIAKAQNAQAGERVFMRCAACHQVGPTAQNGVGPHLTGLFGRSIASVPRYDYSNGLAARAGQPWNEQLLIEYISEPTAFIGERSRMPAQRLRPEQIANLVSYLRSQ